MLNQDMYFVKAKVNQEWKQKYDRKEDWLEGCLIIANNRKYSPMPYMQYRIKPPDDRFSYPIETETLCRSIGLKDSFKQIIYEKDIVELESYNDKTDRFLIWWNQEMSMMTAIPLNQLEFNGNDYYRSNPQFKFETFCLMMQDPYGDFKNIKVVGNIIDNPELLNIDKNLENDFSYE